MGDVIDVDFRAPRDPAPDLEVALSKSFADVLTSEAGLDRPDIAAAMAKLLRGQIYGVSKHFVFSIPVTYNANNERELEVVREAINDTNGKIQAKLLSILDEVSGEMASLATDVMVCTMRLLMERK